MSTILVVDDDHKLIEMLRRTLAYEGYHVLTAEDGDPALAVWRAQRPDLVILDWMLPRRDGIQVARAMRAESDTPILLLTARDSIDDRVTGLDHGADDYLMKPFAPPELLARVRALLRRASTGAGAPLAYGSLSLDPATRDVCRGERLIALSPREFELLAFLLRHPRQVMSREQILTSVWGEDGTDDVLDVYIGYLRAKTEAGGERRVIHTVRGVGYVLREEHG